MTAEDWIMGVVLGPLFLIAVWIAAIRVWRNGLNVDDAVKWLTGEDALPGYYGFLGPGVIACTALWLGAMATKVQEAMDSPPGWLDPAIGTVMVLGLAMFVLGAWLWMTRWPKFLIPPQARDR